MKWIFSIVTAGVLFAGSANAKLMEFDLESEGDGLVTLDTNSGLMWLDLTVTGGKSISQVKAMLANGELEGWRLPVAQDVYDLALSTFSSLNDSINSSIEKISFSVDQPSNAKAFIIVSFVNPISL